MCVSAFPVPDETCSIEMANDHAAHLACESRKTVWLFSRRVSIGFDATGTADLPAEARPDMPCEPYLVISGERVHFDFIGGNISVR
jgi:hypothetical protein